MTVHLLTVGLSVLDALHAGRTARGQILVPPDIQQAPLEVLPTPGRLLVDRIAAVLAPAGPDRDEATRDRLIVTGQDLGVATWPKEASAELSGLPAITDWSKDAVLLICSDDAVGDGLHAGLWNALAMSGNDLDRVALHTDAKDPLRDIHGKVTLVRVRGMDVGSEDGFRKAMEALGVFGQDVGVGTGVLTRGRGG